MHGGTINLIAPQVMVPPYIGREPRVARRGAFRSTFSIQFQRENLKPEPLPVKEKQEKPTIDKLREVLIGDAPEEVTFIS